MLGVRAFVSRVPCACMVFRSKLGRYIDDKVAEQSVFVMK